MQDSIEDYIKIAGVGRNKAADSADDKLTCIQATLECKKKSEEYAQRIVEFLIEGKLTPQIFLKRLQHINQSLYDDVVDERAIEKLCGYPICGNYIPEMPEKKYLILAKVNKVFDLTDRKKYCSNFCYKASIHIKKQIDNSPLWLRKPDSLCDYDLLPNMTIGLTPGEELVNGVQLTNKESTFTSVSAFTEVWLDEAGDNLPHDIDKCVKKSNGNVDEVKPSTSSEAIIKNQVAESNQFFDHTVQLSGNEIGGNEIEHKELKESIQNICRSLNIRLDLNVTSDLPTTTSTTITTTSTDVVIDKEKMNKVIEKVNELEMLRNQQPILIDTKLNPEMQFSKNKSKIVEPPKYSQRIIEMMQHNSIEQKKKQEVNSIQDEKLKKILEKLKHKNSIGNRSVIIIDTVENPEAHQPQLEESVKKSVTTTTVLEYNEIAEILNAFRQWLTVETFVYLFGEERVRERLQLDSYLAKFKALELESASRSKYLEICNRLQLGEHFDRERGTRDSDLLRSVADYFKLKQDTDNMNKQAQAFYTGQIVAKAKKVEESEMVNGEVILPLVEVSNTTVLRRGVFLKSITRYLKNHIIELELPESTVSTLQNFIKTFKFEANNIVFKPAQWSVIALVLINCLKTLDNDLLSSDESTEYLTTHMTKFTNSMYLINETILILDNFDRFIHEYILGNP